MEWTIDVRGPNGVQTVTVPDEKVQGFGDADSYDTSDPYVIAAWLGFLKIHEEAAACQS